MTFYRERYASFDPVVGRGRASRARRAVALALLGLAAGGGHWAAMRGVARLLSAESVGRKTVQGPVEAVRLVARESPPLHDVAAAAPRQAPRPVPPVPAARPRPRPPASAAAQVGTSAQAPADADPSAAEAYRFYDASEVDVTAEPVSHWNLEPAALDALAVSRIAFTLFVGRDGSVLLCSVDAPERLTPEQRKDLSARLAETRMRPARLAGVAVPSRRHVELFTVGGG